MWEGGELIGRGLWTQGPGGHLEGFQLCSGSIWEPREASEQGRDVRWPSQARAGLGIPSGDGPRDGASRGRVEPSAHGWGPPSAGREHRYP